MTPPPPFLSVITRTQGRRPHTLSEALASLAGQTDQDFEVLLVAHRVPPCDLPALQAALAILPDGARSRARLIVVDHGTRTAPLNAGLDAAAGEFVAILDDDDITLPNWVATFRRLAAGAPGCMLRAATRQQTIIERRVDGQAQLVTVGEPAAVFPDDFDIFDHLSANLTPPVALAFPRARLHALGLRFDASLTTTEDWDFILRCAGPLGVATTPEVTAIYRYWEQAECSRTVHADAEWRANYLGISAKLDAAPFVLPPGDFLRLRQLCDRLRAVQAPTAELSARLVAAEDARQALLAEISELRGRLTRAEGGWLAVQSSTSWRLTAPLRWLATRLRRPWPA